MRETMKINNIQGSQTVISEQKTSQPVSGADFKNLLEAQLQSVSSSPSVLSVSPAAVSQAPAALRVEGLSVAEATMTRLESFGTALNDLSLSGESLEPFVEALEEETSAILQLKQQLPEEDPLNKLLDRVASVSYVEAAKYRRGDYH